MSARTLAVAVLLLSLPLLAAAQSPELKLPSFDHLRREATESVDISIGAWPLKVAAWFMDKDDSEEAELKKLFGGLKSIHVRSYTFDSDFVYSESDLDAVREQLHKDGWSQLVQVRDRGDGTSVDICILYDGERAKGLALVASEPRELTILNIVGSIDLDSLDELEGHLGIPQLDVLHQARRAH